MYTHIARKRFGQHFLHDKLHSVTIFPFCLQQTTGVKQKWREKDTDYEKEKPGTFLY